MSFERRRLLFFAAAFVPLFPLFVWVYTVVLAPYQLAVLTLVNPVLERGDPPVRVDVGAEGDLLAYFREADGSRQPLFTREYHADVVFLSLILLPPLLLATPVAPWHRLRLCGIGLALLYLVHVFSLIGLFRATLCLQQRPGHLLCEWLLGVALTSGQLGAVAIWALLSWTVWFEASDRRARV